MCSSDFPKIVGNTAEFLSFGMNKLGRPIIQHITFFLKWWMMNELFSKIEDIGKTHFQKIVDELLSQFLVSGRGSSDFS